MRCGGRDDPYSVQLLARLDEVLEDFAKGADASLALQAPSPLKGLLVHGRAALARAEATLRAVPSPVPLPAAPEAAGDAATEAAGDAAPEAAPAAKKACVSKPRAPLEWATKPRAPVGRPPRCRPVPVPGDTVPADDDKQVAALKAKHNVIVSKLEDQITELKDKLRGSIKNESRMSATRWLPSARRMSSSRSSRRPPRCRSSSRR